MGLGADDKMPQLRIPAGIEAEFDKSAVQTEQIAGNGMHRSGAKILHQFDLPATVAGGSGNDQGSEPFGTILKAKTTGEQAITADILKHIVRANTGTIKGARHQIGPGGQVVLIVKYYRGIAGGAAGTVQPHRTIFRHGQKTVGEMIAQILFGGKGQTTDILNMGQSIGGYPGVGKLLTIKGGARSAKEGFLQPFQLQRLQTLQRQLLNFRFPIHIRYVLLNRSHRPETGRRCRT